MTLILVLSLILGATPFFKNVDHLAVAPAADAPQVVVARGAGGGLRRVPELGTVDRAGAGHRDPLRHARPSSKGIPIDFLFLLAALAGAGAIWQFGFSGSAPLLMATPGNFLEKTTGVMPLSHDDLVSGGASILVVAFMVAVRRRRLRVHAEERSGRCRSSRRRRGVAGEPATATDDVPPAARPSRSGSSTTRS